MLELIEPRWPAPATLRACTTTRRGGVSEPPYDGFNLAGHVGDDAAAVAANRERLAAELALPAEPFWLDQVHEAKVVEAGSQQRRADASFSVTPGQVCAVLTADCLPLLLCDLDATRVAACHAGWRGLHAGVIEATLAGFDDASRVLAWLGPAIGPAAYEVGEDVYRAFTDQQSENAAAFVGVDADHWLCDIYRLARTVLEQHGVTHIYGGDFCTATDLERFYSYRRDGATGRMASLIWLDPSCA